MSSEIQHINNAPVVIEKSEVMRLLGAGAIKRQLNQATENLIRGEIERGQRLVRPRASYNIFPVQVLAEGTVKIYGGGELHIGKMARRWGGLTCLALAICTIGQPIEDEITRLFHTGEMASAVVLDSVGSVAVESVADYVNQQICDRALAAGLSLTHRISPGYSDWPLNEQQAIFALLAADNGVTLTESFMMHPRKSVSFAAALVKSPIAPDEPRKCAACNMKKCAYRRSN
jgi:hypothetical protein